MKTIEKIDADLELMCSSIEQKASTYNLILLNDDHHSMGEVVRQIIKAVKCTSVQAMGFMKEAHHTGAAVVLSASLEECKTAQKVLEEIQLGTRIEKL